MFETIENYARRIDHRPLIRFIAGSQALHDILGIRTRDVLYDCNSGELRASLEILPIHQGTAYGENSIMYGIIIAALADMATGAAVYLHAGADRVVTHKETRIRYIRHVPILAGSRLFIEINVSEIRNRLKAHYCTGTVYQEHSGVVQETARVWAKIPSMLERTFDRLLR